MVYQLRILWTAAGGAGGETAMHFDDGSTPPGMQATVDAFLDALEPILATGTSARYDTVIKRFDEQSGALVEEIAQPLGANHVGTGGPTAVPNVAQGLIRLNTGQVVGRRILKGRIYVPGMSSNTMASIGEVGPTGLTALQAAGDALIAGTGIVVVWHRPVNGANGSVAEVVQANPWTEFASQRRRRS